MRQSSEWICSGLGAVDNLHSHLKKSIKKINNTLEYFYMINISSAANEIYVCDKLGLRGLLTGRILISASQTK